LGFVTASRWRASALAAGALSALLATPAAAEGTLTLPFANPNPVITSWMDHHYPTRLEDGLMVRFDGRTGFPYDGHRGTDYAIAANTPVVAADDGTVTYAEWSDSGGHGVVLEHAGNRSAYFHNNVLFVYPGQRVSRGQLLALSGSTGNSTGPHVHFEVRDLFPYWHAIDPFGWTGPGKDPWRFDQGYLWTTDPPTPFVLPLAFLSGARWNSWYGLAEAPPGVQWRIQDGQWGFTGWRMAWDADPATAAAPLSTSRTGSASLPGPGRHTLHLRVYDRAGHTADIVYLYLYDQGRPALQAQTAPTRTPMSTVRWSASDSLSGVLGFRADVRVDEGEWRPWFELLAPGVNGGDTARGSAVLVALPGHHYTLRTVSLNQARNASAALEQELTLAPSAQQTGPLDGVVVPLPAEAPPPPAAFSLARAEVRAAFGGGYLLDAWGGILPLAGAPPLDSPRYQPGAAWAADLLLRREGGGYIVGIDGTLTPLAGASPLAAGPLAAGRQAVRGALVEGGALVVDQLGSFSPTAGLPVPRLAEPLTPGSTAVDMAILGGLAGVVLDSAGRVHAFAPPGSAAPSTAAFPPEWPLSAPPRALALGASGAGYLIAADGSRELVGSLLRLERRWQEAPLWDSRLGLPIR
jgi:hypothetical protein